MTPAKMRNAVTSVALDLLWLWNNIQCGAVELDNVWYKVGERQAYHDALNSMKSRGLIEDFDMVKVAVLVNGQWIFKGLD